MKIPENGTQFSVGLIEKITLYASKQGRLTGTTPIEPAPWDAITEHSTLHPATENSHGPPLPGMAKAGLLAGDGTGKERVERASEPTSLLTHSTLDSWHWVLS